MHQLIVLTLIQLRQQYHNQTAISLIQDPKGWDVIEELLQNPDLIEQYVGKSGNIQGLLGKSTSNGGKKSSASSSFSVLPSDGDLGVDFTNKIDGGNNILSGNSKSIKVATSIDSGSDYYTSVDKTPPSIDYDYEGVETVNVEEIIESKIPATLSTTTISTVPKKKEEPPLPELSFSVDETPEISSSIDTDPDYGSQVSVDEIQLDAPVDSFNIDTAPAAVSQPDAKLPSFNNEWKSTLFGPKGMFTEVFRFVNEKRKQGFEKATPQSDLPPPSPINDSKFDLPKIFDALMKSSDNGFDDPKIPEIPFIGICNRLNCGDIYKAVDQFKKSELFSNFQTAISLIQDPKGWDVIEELLQNPDLIEQYVGKSGNIQGLLGKSTSNVVKKSSASSSFSVLPSDGDLGVDFTNEIDGGNSISSGNSKSIKVATSIDSGSDYYTSVDKTPPSIDYDYEGAETVNVEEIIESKIPATLSTTTISTVPKKKEEPPLPELSFSVDETPEISSSIDTAPDYGSQISIDEVVPSSKNDIGIKKQQLNALERRFVLTSTLPLLSTTTHPPLATTTFSTPLKKITSPKPRKNFRRSDDYYSMYYDNN
uniref:Uncharacterized protein n=1 Tax=Panagrolaimus sp. ES5 TaxID=591445 RepID=A0AC34FID9_9BILA